MITAFTIFQTIPQTASGRTVKSVLGNAMPDPALRNAPSELVSDTIPGNKVITNAQMIGIGSVQILDTYLSPEEYSGTEVRYLSHTERRREGSRWSRLLLHQGSFSYSKNRADNGNYVAGAYSFSYGMHFNWQFLGGRMNVRAGGQADLDAGFLYNTRNGNNPAQARFSLDVSPSAAVSYRFRLGRVPFKAQYEAAVPLVGVMFSPNYGQSYYEIFTRGNYDHNVVPTTIGCMPSLRQILTVDFTLCRTTFRIGWLGDYRQAKVNSLKYHEYSNLLMIGIVRSFKLTKIIP